MGKFLLEKRHRFIPLRFRSDFWKGETLVRTGGFLSFFWEEVLGFLGFGILKKKKKNGGVLLGRCCLMRFDAARTVALGWERFLQGEEAREDGVSSTADVIGSMERLIFYVVVSAWVL